MTYIQANFCNSMVDMDLFFLQICATQLPAHIFLKTAIDVFGVTDWLGMCSMSPQEMEQDSMLEGLLTFLATMVTSRTNLGNSEPTQCKIEISALLATGDKTHSQLLELMPERSGNAHTRNFEKFLKELSIFRRPPVGSENLDQGLFIPVPDVWENYYDPLHVLLRAVHRRDFQNSMDRFNNYVKQENKMPKSGTLWPPFRLPGAVGYSYTDPSCILHSQVLHAALLGILYRAVHSHNVSEHMLALAVFLLEMAVTTTDTTANKDTVLECGRTNNASGNRNSIDPPELLNCYPGDRLSENLRYTVSRISLTPNEPQVSPANYNTTTFDSDLEWDVSETETLPMIVGSEGAVPQDLSIVRAQSIMLHSNSDSDANMDEDILPAQSLPPLTLGDNIQTIAPYTPRRNDHHHHIGPRMALPSTTSSPGSSAANFSGSGREVVIHGDIRLAAPSAEMFTASSGAGSGAGAGMLLPFQRVLPVVVPSRNLDIVPTTTAASQRRMHAGMKKKHVDLGNSYDSESILIEESIISLLLKLHSQLSGTLDSFSLETDHNDESQAHEMDIDADEAGPSSRATPSPSLVSSMSRIGDGPFFIGNLLHKIANLDEMCLRSINELRQNMWPNQREKQAEQEAREIREKEERSKRAKERQQRMIDEFAKKQKQFMEGMTEGMDCCAADVEDAEEAEEWQEKPREKEYVCIICNNTSPSTEGNPIGLVVLVESSGVIGHRRKTGNFNINTGN